MPACSKDIFHLVNVTWLVSHLGPAGISMARVLRRRGKFDKDDEGFELPQHAV